MQVKKYLVAKNNCWKNYIGEVNQWVCVSKIKYILLKLFGYNVMVQPFSDGDEITITWLPNCRNCKFSKNPYIGMSGKVQDLKQNGEFCLYTGTSTLVCSGKLNYIKHNNI